MDENKTAGLDNLSGKFLKDGATVLAKPISRICNLSIKYSIILLISKIMVKNKSNWLVLKQLTFKTAVFVCQPLSQIIARVSSNQLVFLERSLLCGTFTLQLHVKSSVRKYYSTIHINRKLVKIYHFFTVKFPSIDFE